VSLRIKKLFFLLIWILVAVAALFALVLPRRSGRDTAPSSGLSESARRELEVYLTEQSAVLASIPSHLLSDEVFQKVAAVYRKDLRIDQCRAEELIAEQFCESPLGLYALRRYLSEPAEGESAGTDSASTRLEFCKHLCENYHDTRISLMAFDHLWKSAPNRLDVCEQYIAKDPDSKFGVFALMRKGDTYLGAGQDALAALCYLKAWQKEPERGKKLYGSLRDIWLAHGDWIHPVLMSGDYVESRVLDPIKARALSEIQAICDACSHDAACPPARLWNADVNKGSLKEVLSDEHVPVQWRAKAGLVLAGSLLDIGKRTEAIAAFQQAHRLLSEKGQSLLECVDLGVAVFLLRDVPPRDKQPESFKQSLELLRSQADLSQIRETFLELAKRSFDLITPDEQAYYTHLVAQRYLDDSDIKKALETLILTSQIEGTSLRLRQDAVLEEAKIYADEWHAYYQAGKLCAEFCSKLAKEDVPEDVCYKAGMYYFRAQAYDDALLQFQKLLSDDRNEPTKTASEFMIGLCHMQKGNSEVAIQSFRDFASRYPDSDLSSRALYLEGMCHLSSQRYNDALVCFQRLIDRYPESEYAKRAKEYVTRLANLGDKK